MHPQDYIRGICSIENYAAISSLIMEVASENLTCDVIKMKENLMIDDLHFITQKHSVVDKRFSSV